MLFPMCIALRGSLRYAAYALFARDGRLPTPDGTVRIDIGRMASNFTHAP